MNQYPSSEELMPPILMAKLPGSLANRVKERYEGLGGKYVTAHLHHDGRPINGMMLTDRIDNCEEEVVDAVFCILGQIFKDSKAGIEPSDILYHLLSGLIEVYSGLVYMKESGEYTVAI